MRRLLGGAPLTMVWLAVLFATTIVQHELPQSQLNVVLERRSTNLANLNDQPIQALTLSLLWLAGAYWVPYAVLFLAFLAPAERWLGSVRWLFIGLAGHIVSTLATQYLVARAILARRADPSLIHARDIGVSYFMVAIIGVLTYRFVGVWRWAFGGLVVTIALLALVLDPGFTNLGHALALAIGLVMYPIAPKVGADGWNLRTAGERAWARITGRATA